MSSLAIGLTLLAATLQACWNAVLRGGVDPLWSITVMSLSTIVVTVPLAIALPWPVRASWPYLLSSACLQIGYCVFLVSAYRYGELGQVFPIVRGSVPLLVTGGGLLFAHQYPHPLALLGIVLVAAGIISLALGRQRTRTRSVALALGAGLFIASYVTIDGLGVRVAGDSRVYPTWIFLLDGLLMPLTFIALRGRFTIDMRSPETWKATAAGYISLISYMAFVTALSLGPIGPLSALRETSVVFAALIGWLFLGEALTARRLGACAVVALGAYCIG